MPATKIKNQLLIDGTLSFPDLFEAKSIGGGKPRYSATLLLDKVKDKAAVKEIHDVIESIIKEEFDGKKIPSDKLPIHDGDDKDYEGYAGCYALSANKAESQGRPTTVDRDKTPLTAADGKLKGGNKVRMVVSFYALNGNSAKKKNDYGKRICCALEVVQYLSEGTPFGAPKVNVDDVLPELPDDDGADDI